MVAVVVRLPEVTQLLPRKDWRQWSGTEGDWKDIPSRVVNLSSWLRPIQTSHVNEMNRHEDYVCIAAGLDYKRNIEPQDLWRPLTRLKLLLV